MDNIEESRKETLEHIRVVGEYMKACADALLERAAVHDQSKLHSPEVEDFAKLNNTLHSCSFGSAEYEHNKQTILSKALKHHYASNTHHPEHYENGIRGMCLLDIVEAFCDWKAASKRHKDGDIYASIDSCQKRFGFSDDLADIFRNTAIIFEKEGK